MGPGVAVVGAVAGVLLGAAGAAHAWQSTVQPAVWSGDFALAAPWDYDSGWVPQSSPIQLRFTVAVGTGLRATLAGRAEVSWPLPLSLQLRGEPGGGLLSMDVGVSLATRLRLHLDLPNGEILDWEGDVPPHFDFRFAAEQAFDPFLLRGGTPDAVTVADGMQRVRVLSVDLAALVGVDFPGVSGGLSLLADDVELRATLRGQRFDLEGLAGGATAHLETAGAAAVLPDPTGSPVTLAPHYLAQLSLGGSVTLRPAVFVSVMGKSWDLPLASFPVSLPELVDRPWDFGRRPLRFPLPVIAVDPAAVDCGVIGVDDVAVREVRVDNLGELELALEARTEGAGFSVAAPADRVPPGGSLRLAVSCGATARAGVLLLTSSDPLRPSVAVPLRAGTAGVEPPPGDGGAPATPGDGGAGGGATAGCGCQASRARGGLAVLVLAAAWRRRR